MARPVELLTDFCWQKNTHAVESSTQSTGRSIVPKASRDIFEDADGRQYVHGDEGEKVYGTWLPPVDEPIVTEARSHS